MIFIDPQGNYPRFLGDLLLEHPDWNKRKKLPAGWTKVEETSPPVRPRNVILEEDYPEIIDGKAYQKWKLRNIRQEEKGQAKAFLEKIKDQQRL